jgi:type IX secretion system PorP/SprF family membrane protein
MKHQLNHTNRLILLMMLMISGIAPLRSQDPNFSHFMMSPIYYNPAACGMRDALELRFAYRNLWYGIHPMFHTAKFSGSMFEPGIGGLGLLAMTNIEGDGFLKTTNVGFCYANKFPLIENTLSCHFGLTSSLVQKSIDWSKLHFDDEFDKVMGQIYPSGFTPPDFNTVFYPDFNFGTILTYGAGKGFYSQTLYYNELGVAFNHLTQPDHSLTGSGSKLPVKTVIHFKGVYKGAQRKDIYFNPGAMMELQGGMRTLMYGGNMMFNPLFMGLWVRNRRLIDMQTYDAIVITAGIGFDNRDKTMHTVLNYTYDFTISRLAPGTLGSHEINIYVRFEDVSILEGVNKRSRFKRKHNAVPCPHPGIRI